MCFVKFRVVYPFLFCLLLIIMYPFSVLRFFRVVSRVAVLFLTICGCCALNAQALDEAPKPPSNRVYSYDMNDGFGLDNYESAVESVLGLFEESKGEAYMPQTKGRVGIKVYSDSGAGLSTPEALVEAVVGALERRGYERSQIFILGLSGHTLRDAGFLPPLSRRSVYFNQVFVESLDTGLYYHSDWFYDSPLPSPFENLQIEVDEDSGRVSGVKERVERKSLLPMPLMHEVDFWINMPCYSDHPTLGVNGALMNATMWNASNTMRFLNNPASASVAVAEMGAIPELRETWALNIVSLAVSYTHLTLPTNREV